MDLTDLLCLGKSGSVYESIIVGYWLCLSDVVTHVDLVVPLHLIMYYLFSLIHTPASCLSPYFPITVVRGQGLIYTRNCLFRIRGRRIS
jgi:hypothetical protein